MDFATLFSSKGLDHATAHIFLLLVSSADEECWLWPAKSVSRTWREAIDVHVLGSRVGKMCLDQRRTTQMRELEKAFDVFVDSAKEYLIEPEADFMYARLREPRAQTRKKRLWVKDVVLGSIRDRLLSLDNVLERAEEIELVNKHFDNWLPVGDPGIENHLRKLHFFINNHHLDRSKRSEYLTWMKCMVENYEKSRYDVINKYTIGYLVEGDVDSVKNHFGKSWLKVLHCVYLMYKK